MHYYFSKGTQKKIKTKHAKRPYFALCALGLALRLLDAARDKVVRLLCGVARASDGDNAVCRVWHILALGRNL